MAVIGGLRQRKGKVEGGAGGWDSKRPRIEHGTRAWATRRQPRVKQNDGRERMISAGRQAAHRTHNVPRCSCGVEAIWGEGSHTPLRILTQSRNCLVAVHIC